MLFAAVKTWDEHLNCFNLNHGADLLTERLSVLYKPFAVYGDFRPWKEEAAAALRAASRDGESSVELWYLVAKRPFECVAISSSFLPVIAYYLHKIEEWGYVFQSCKVCGKDFLARSRHFELCSDECRRVQAVEAKREFDGRAKGDRLEQLDEAAYYYWYNRLRKLNRSKNEAFQKLFTALHATRGRDEKGAEGAQTNQDTGLSRYSRNTKIHAVADGLGNPIRPR
jgi:hypothetical protein